MIAAIFISEDPEELQRMIEVTKLPQPVIKDGRRVGSVHRLWIYGNTLMAEIEGVPSDFEHEKSY